VILGASYAGGWGNPKLPGFDTVINRGVSGEETGDMLRRFDRDVVAARPAAVLIWGHVNDITRSKPERLEATKLATREHYRRMINKARAARVDVILATEVPWTEATGFLNELRAYIGHLRGKQSYAQRVSAHVRELNAFVRELATREGAVLLDFERVFANEEGTRRIQFSAEDGSHISQAGYEALTSYSTRILNPGK
jgi:lysophospholipase L1-like esterase